MTPHTAPLASPAPACASAERKSTWTVGTLTYTYRGLVGLFVLLLIGDFVWTMRDRSAMPMSQWFLSSLSVPNWLFGLLLTTFPAMLGLVLAPIISVRSDRHRRPRGRRIPFLLWTTPIAAAGMIGIGLTPLIAGWLHGLSDASSALGTWLHQAAGTEGVGARLLALLENKMVVSVVCFGVFWAIFEFAAIASQAVFGGLINDVVPIELIGRFYGMFRAVSLLDGIIFNFWVMGLVPGHFTLILVIIGVLYGIGFYWVCLRVKEGSYPPPPPPATGGRIQEVKSYFRDSFRQPYYIAVFSFLTLGNLCFLPINAFSIPYANSLGMSMDHFGKCLAITYTISLFLSFFIGWLADRFHPLRVSMVALVIYTVTSIAGFMLARDQQSFAVFLIIHGVASGSYMTAVASLGQRLFPRSKFAQFASASGILLSVGSIAVGPLVGSVIDLTGGVFRYTFGLGAVLTAMAFVCGWIVYRQFQRLGGPAGYVAPE